MLADFRPYRGRGGVWRERTHTEDLSFVVQLRCGDFCGFDGALIWAGDDERWLDAGRRGAFQNATEFFAALLRQTTVLVATAWRVVLGDAVAEEVEFHWCSPLPAC